jgi:hypothetical protein
LAAHLSFSERTKTEVGSLPSLLAVFQLTDGKAAPGIANAPESFSSHIGGMWRSIHHLRPLRSVHRLEPNERAARPCSWDSYNCEAKDIQCHLEQLIEKQLRVLTPLLIRSSMPDAAHVI